MKVAVTIPAYNEEETVGGVVRECREVLEENGYDHEILVVDDGSNDGTARVAGEAGAHTVSHTDNRGLGEAFDTGRKEALNYDPDVIVNIDADGQYDAGEIPQLIEPVLNGDADMVLGTRDVMSLEHMPLSKKVGNRIGTMVTSALCGTWLKDAQTGFRAFSPGLAARMPLSASYTYVQETLIYAHSRGFEVEEVPSSFYGRDSGDSRLISSLREYILHAAGIVIRAYRDHRPMRAFSLIALLFFLMAALLAVPMVEAFISSGTFEIGGRGVLSGVLAVAGGLVIVMGFLAGMVKKQREVMEEILQELRTEN